MNVLMPVVLYFLNAMFPALKMFVHLDFVVNGSMMKDAFKGPLCRMQKHRLDWSLEKLSILAFVIQSVDFAYS
jgi:hypothetical protein